MNDRPIDEPEQPRSEPEIIPPGRPARHGRAENGEPRVAFGARGFERVYVFRPRPLNVLLTIVALGTVAAALVVLLLGAVLVALPVIGTIVAIALVTAFFRGNRRPVR